MHDYFMVSLYISWILIVSFFVWFFGKLLLVF